jgi:hypothetical protein
VLRTSNETLRYAWAFIPRRNQRIADAIGMTYLSIEEIREALEGVGYSELDVLEDKKIGMVRRQKQK